MEVLPPEIRLMVWRYALSRIIRAEIAVETHSRLLQYYVSFSPRTPALLHVCGESRDEGRRYHTLLEPRPNSGARPV